MSNCTVLNDSAPSDEDVRAHMMRNAIEAEPVPLRRVEPLPTPLQVDVIQRQRHQVAGGADDVAVLFAA